jgi:hypothetical protein
VKAAYKCVGLIVGLESENTLPYYQRTYNSKLIVHHPEPKSESGRRSLRSRKRQRGRKSRHSKAKTET